MILLNLCNLCNLWFQLFIWSKFLFEVGNLAQGVERGLGLFFAELEMCIRDRSDTGQATRLW